MVLGLLCTQHQPVSGVLRAWRGQCLPCSWAQEEGMGKGVLGQLPATPQEYPAQGMKVISPQVTPTGQG